MSRRNGASRPDLDTGQWKRIRAAVRRRDGNACVVCGRSDRLSVHHVVPARLGGGDEMDNLVTVCVLHRLRSPAAPGIEPGEDAPLERRHRLEQFLGHRQPALTDVDFATSPHENAKIAHYGPHALRHRRCSLWLAHRFETVFVKQWSGHSKASLLTDVYGHVMVEPAGDKWRSFWLDAYDRQRRPKAVELAPGVVSVWSETEVTT
jgi:hypothetical protein